MVEGVYLNLQHTCAQASTEQLKYVGCTANLTFLRTCGKCAHLLPIYYSHRVKMLLEIRGGLEGTRSSSLLCESAFCLLYAKSQGEHVICIYKHESFDMESQSEFHLQNRLPVIV